MSNKELDEKKKKIINDLKNKLNDINKKSEEYSKRDKEDIKILKKENVKEKKQERKDLNKVKKNQNTVDPQETIMLPKDKIRNLYKAKEDRKKDKEKNIDVLEKKDDKKELKKRRLEKLEKRKKEDAKIKEEVIKKKIKKGEKVKFKDLSGKQKAGVIIKNIFLVGLFLFIILVGLAFGYIYGLFGNDIGIDRELIDGTPQTTVVYDKNGVEIARLTDDERRTIIKLNEMGNYVPNAYISIEDERFHSHPGIDVKRTLGAAFNYIIKGDSKYGGSTITQQLIKNITNDDERTVLRKIRELSRALQLEQKLSKDEILELYLNLIYVGGENVYGIALASDYYFSKKANELTLEEAAFIAGINHAPGSYNPYIEKGHHLNEKGEVVVDNKEAYDKYLEMFEAINKRTITVLAKMLELDKITKEEYDKAVEAVKAGLKFKKGNLSYSTYEYSHHTDAAIDEAVEALAEKEKIDKKIAKIKLFKGGYHIYTTQDTEMQNKVENMMRTKQYTLLSNVHKDEEGKPYKSQAVTVIIDHKTGKILSAVGGLEDNVRMKRGDWNRVTRTIRQPGSAIKPLVVTAPGLESGKFTLGHTFDDTPYVNGNWRPRNFSGTFMGRVTVRKALVKSLNIPQIRQLELITPQYATAFLERMDFPIDDRDRNNLAISLGGFTNGMTTINMAAGFAMIANDGEYIRPTFLTKIENKDREVVYEPNQKRERMLSKENAFLLKDILKGSTNPGEIAAVANMPNFDIAGKTGTTDEFKDSYYCTFSNLYTAATWYGFDKAESFNNINSGYYNPSLQILSSIFKEIHKGKEPSRFVKPENIITETVLFNKFVKAPKGLTSGVLTELFVKGTEPKEQSNDYISVKVCKESGLLATDDCTDVEVKWFKKGEEPKEYCKKKEK